MKTQVPIASLHFQFSAYFLFFQISPLLLQTFHVSPYHISYLTLST